MTSKVIKVKLTRAREKIALEFGFDDGEIAIVLESNDTNSIKAVFRRLARELCENNIQLDYSVDENTIDKNKDGLFVDASEEYVKRLMSEVEAIKEDENLKIIRNNDESSIVK